MNALGWSTGLFVAFGVVWILIGSLTPFLHDTPMGRSTLIFSGATDTKTFGDTPANVLANEPNVAKLRSILLILVGGLLVAAGLLIVAVSWFALRAGERWALATLSIVGLAVIPFYLLAARPYLAAGTTIHFLDLPPFIWVTTALWIPASALGWWGLRA